MFMIIPIVLLILTSLALVILRISRPGVGFAWPIAVIGAFLAWLSAFFVLFRLPDTLVISKWLPQAIFTYSPTLLIDGINFPYLLGLTALALAAILALVVNAGTINPMAWAGLLLNTALGLFAVMSGNLLTLVLAWSMLDFIELVNNVRIVNGPRASENVVINFSFRISGTGLVLWALVLGFATGGPLTFSTMSAQSALFLLLGVMIRVIAQSAGSANSNEEVLQKVYNPILGLASIAATLVLLARIPAGIFSPTLANVLLLIISLVALVAAFNFLRSPDMLSARPHWIIAFAMMAIAATLSGNPAGSAAWGSALVFSGGILYLVSFRKRWLVALLLAGVYMISALPFSLTAIGWAREPLSSWLSLILFVPAQVFLMTGYLRAIIRSSVEPLENQPAWVRVFYPAGMVILVISGFMAGLIGFSGARQLGEWIPAIISTVLCIALTILLQRLSVPEPPQLAERIVRRPLVVIEWTRNFIGGAYRLLGSTVNLLARTLEGDGGFLWTILLLVLFISILQGFYK